MPERTPSERLGIKWGKPLSRRQLKRLEEEEQQWNREVFAYMEKHGVGFDEAFVACGGEIIPLVRRNAP